MRLKYYCYPHFADKKPRLEEPLSQETKGHCMDTKSASFSAGCLSLSGLGGGRGGS